MPPSLRVHLVDYEASILKMEQQMLERLEYTVKINSENLLSLYPVIFLTDSQDAAEHQGGANPVVKDW